MMRMRIAFIQTYPIYHDLVTTEQWLRRDDRDRWIPQLIVDLGHEVELWAVGQSSGVYTSGGYTIRVFEPSVSGDRTKYHHSDDLVSYARSFEPGLCILKGVDGGVGVRLIERYLKPQSVPYVMIVGGKFYTKHVPDASVVMYEDDYQHRQLSQPSRWWRRRVDADRLIQLPKTIDTNLFRPMPDVEKTWDVLTVGRLIPRYKNFEALGKLPRTLSVAVAGGGSALPDLQKRYPWITWLGQIDREEVPEYLNRARLFFHSSLRDHYPRVIAEAASCGIPSVVFGSAIGPDVVSPNLGLRVTSQDLANQVQALLRDPARMEQMSANCRAHAEAVLSRTALRASVEDMLGVATRSTE